jgi:hypothetical protein
MRLTSELEAERRQRVESRLRTNLMAWLTTVTPAGKPDTGELCWIPTVGLFRSSAVVVPRPQVLPASDGVT